MEGRDGAMDRIGRTIWTVWGYLTGAVGRYIRPEVTTEGNQNINLSQENAEDNVTNKEGCRESKNNEEEKQTWNKLERKTKEVPGGRVRVAAVRWEKGSFDTDAHGHDEIKEECGANKNMHASCVWTVGVQQKSSKDIDKKSNHRNNKETLDSLLNINNKVRTTESEDHIKSDDRVDPSASIDANVNSQDLRVSEREREEEQKDDGDQIITEDVKEKKCLEHDLELEEQSHSSSFEDGKHLKEDSVEKIVERFVDEEKTKESDNKQTNQGKTEEGDKLQMADEDSLFRQTCSVKEQEHLLKAAVKEEVKIKDKCLKETTEATPPGHEEININISEEPPQWTVGRNECSPPKEVMTCAALEKSEFTDGDVGDEQEIPELKLDETQMEFTEGRVKNECDLLKQHMVGQMETVEIYEKRPEPNAKMGMNAEDSAMPDATDLLMVTAEPQTLEQCTEDSEARNALELTLKTEVVQFNDTADDVTRLKTEIRQDLRLVFCQDIKSGSGNQLETQETTTKFHHTLTAEVAMEDVKKSAEERGQHQQQLRDVEMDQKESEDQSLFIQGSVQETPFDGKINVSGLMKAPSNEMLKDQVDSEQVDESTADEMPLTILHKTDCSVETRVGSLNQATVSTKTSSTEQNVEVLGTQVEVTAKGKHANTELKYEQEESANDNLKTGSESSLSTTETISVKLNQSVEAEFPILCDISEAQTPFEDPPSQKKCVAQDRLDDKSFGVGIGSLGASGSTERESALRTLGVQAAQSSHEAENEIHKETEVITFSKGVEKEISGLIRESFSETKEESEYERCMEITDYNNAVSLAQKDLTDNLIEELNTDVTISEEVERNLDPHLVTREESMDQCLFENKAEQETLVENKMDEEFSLMEAQSSEMLRKKVDNESNFAVQVDASFKEVTGTVLSHSPKKMEKTESSIEISGGLVNEPNMHTVTNSTEQNVETLQANSEITAMETQTFSEEKCEQVKFDHSKTESESSPSVMDITSESLSQSVKTETHVLGDITETWTSLKYQLCHEEFAVQNTSLDKIESLGLGIGSSENPSLPENESTLETIENPEKHANIHNTEIEIEKEIKGMPSVLDAEEGLSEILGKTEVPEVKDESRSTEVSKSLISHWNLKGLDSIVDGNRNLEEEVIGIENSAHRQTESLEKIPQFAAGEEKLAEKVIAGKERDRDSLDIFERNDTTDVTEESTKKVGKGEIVDSNKNSEERNRPAQKRRFEKMARYETDASSASKSWSTTDFISLQASSLDFTAQKSKIAVKNPVVRPPKDPRTLINMPSVEPLTPPRPLQLTPLPVGQRQGAAVPGKVIGFKLPGLGADVPVLRKTEAGRKIKEEGTTQSETSQTPGVKTDTTKQEHTLEKPKWTPPRHPGMGSPLMMTELKSKLKKTAKE